MSYISSNTARSSLELLMKDFGQRASASRNKAVKHHAQQVAKSSTSQIFQSSIRPKDSWS